MAKKKLSPKPKVMTDLQQVREHILIRAASERRKAEEYLALLRRIRRIRGRAWCDVSQFAQSHSRGRKADLCEGKLYIIRCTWGYPTVRYTDPFVAEWTQNGWQARFGDGFGGHRGVQVWA